MEYGFFNTVDEVVRFWGIVFGIWAISATVCLGWASWKEKNVVLWFLLGLFFGPFALAVLIYKSGKKKTQSDQLLSPNSDLKKDQR